MKIKIILNSPADGHRECDLLPEQWPGFMDGTWTEIHLLMTPADPLSPSVTLRREETE